MYAVPDGERARWFEHLSHYHSRMTESWIYFCISFHLHPTYTKRKVARIRVTKLKVCYLKKKKNNKLVVNSRLCYHVNTGALGWRHPFLPHVDMLCERAVKMCLLAKIKKKERKNDIPGVSYYEKLSREIDFECRHTTISGQQTQRRKGTKGMA